MVARGFPRFLSWGTGGLLVMVLVVTWGEVNLVVVVLPCWARGLLRLAGVLVVGLLVLLGGLTRDSGLLSSGVLVDRWVDS